MRWQVLIGVLLLTVPPACDAEMSGGSLTGGRMADYYAHVLAAQHFNDTSDPPCQDGEDDTPPNVLATVIVGGGGLDCNRTASPDPAEGAQYAYLGGVATGLTSVVYKDVFEDITSGPVVYEDYFQVIVDGEDVDTNFIWAFHVAGHSTWPWLYMKSADDQFALRCDTDTWSYSPNNTYDGTWQKRKVEWHLTGGPGDCDFDPPAPDCAGCGCLYIDDVQVAQCNATAEMVGVSGLGVTALAGVLDAGVDRWALCDELPPDGTSCGDSPTFP